MGALRRAVPVPSARPFLKRPRSQVVDTATCGTAAREKPARHAAGAGEAEFPVRDPKRAKLTCNGGVRPVDAALGTLRKRMAAELDAVRALLRKAELLSGGKNGRSTTAAAKQRSEAPVEEAASVKLKPPPAKRWKAASAVLAKTAKLESRDLHLPDDKDEFIDICGGVSPVAIQSVSPLVAAEKACESGESESSRDLRPEDESESIDICSGVSPVVCIDKKAVNVQVPPAVLPEKNGRSVQPPREPAASEVVQSTAEQEELITGKKRAAPAVVLTAALITKAKVRQTLLEMERAVVPDESILPRDLKDLCVVEYVRVSVMQRLGLFLKADA